MDNLFLLKFLVLKEN